MRAEAEGGSAYEERLEGSMCDSLASSEMGHSVASIGMCDSVASSANMCDSVTSSIMGSRMGIITDSTNSNELEEARLGAEIPMGQKKV